MLHLIRKLTIATVLLFSMSAAGYAKSTTIGAITLDVPDAFQASESDRGVELKTPDEEVYTWLEVYKGSENDTLRAEHEKYWKDNDVVLNDPQTTDRKVGDINVSTMFFPNATWQGKPTILRYVKVGPVAASGTMVLMTVWASPEGIKAHGKEVEHMLDTLNVKIPQ
ncbi:MAG: hypothetical protein AB1508_10370 [Pseudomonadota bacterium]